jgi:hypothetical protein
MFAADNHPNRELDRQQSKTSTSIREAEEPTPSWLESMMTRLPTFRKEQYEQHNERKERKRIIDAVRKIYLFSVVLRWGGSRSKHTK